MNGFKFNKVMKHYYLLFTIVFLFYGCKTNQTVNGLKEGKWILTDTVNNDVLKIVEKYKKGNEVKTWKIFKNKKIYKTEKYKGTICHVIYYYPNGKKSLEGNTKLEIKEDETHWFYHDEWKVFDEKGKLIKLKYYESGIQLSEIEVK